jgi:DNA primase
MQRAEEQEKRNKNANGSAENANEENNGTAIDEVRQEIIKSYDKALHHKERAIIQFLLKNGSKLLQVPENKENNIPAFTETVLSHLFYSFDEDGIEISHPLYARIFKEATEHMSNTEFNPERHFMAHPDHEISSLTAELCGERYLLSKFFTEQGNDERNEQAVLFEQTTRLAIAYKLSIVDDMLKETMEKLKNPETLSDPEKMQAAMEDFKFLKETQRALNDVLKGYGFGNVALNI